MFIKAKVLLCLLLILPALLQAELEVSPFFGNHRVLQQEQDLPVWGAASPGETVTVSFRKRSVQAEADAAGDWRASSPHSAQPTTSTHSTSRTSASA